MIFLRLAGCSVGCPLCDTDYSVSRRLSVEEIADEILVERKRTYTNWVWITGGEPLDHDLAPLLERLRELDLNICIATSGHKQLPDSWLYRLGCWVSVSPHIPSRWEMRTGNELKIVPQLFGHSLAEFITELNSKGHGFRSKWVMPCAGKPETVQECRDFVLVNRGWNMGGQLHKGWGLP